MTAVSKDSQLTAAPARQMRSSRRLRTALHHIRPAPTRTHSRNNTTGTKPHSQP
ncbi:hypothetical protein [Streptomyces sp. NPDC101178]|uniref:hypothetical protein n=1 Tax=Streptomyces sp. NPDC101178 TaxID=3366124 RepID=UPI003827D8DC